MPVLPFKRWVAALEHREVRRAEGFQGEEGEGSVFQCLPVEQLEIASRINTQLLVERSLVTQVAVNHSRTITTVESVL